MTADKTPSVLIIGGHDPSGAGIQADIETCAALGCHAACVVTAITAQNTRTVSKIAPVDPDLITDQGKRLLEDYPFTACKVGLIPTMATLGAVSGLLADCSLPIVVDPVLAAGSGTQLVQNGLTGALVSDLLPEATVCTPNLSEARLLTGEDELDEIGKWLNEVGCDYVLLTGADEPTDDVNNYLYRAGKRLMEFTWKRLPHRYHGSGCTLATGIAAGLAAGQNVISAVEEAQSFTWRSLRMAIDLGAAQSIPNRFADIGR